jgi:hypothetical protein
MDERQADARPAAPGTPPAHMWYALVLLALFPLPWVWINPTSGRAVSER